MKIKKNEKKLYIDTNTGISKLKKALNVIHKYNINNKRILFIGNFNKNLENVLIKTKHLCVPESIWVNGILTNPYACFKYLIKHQHSIGKKKMRNIAPLKKRIDLIVLMDIISASNILNESYATQVPVILCDLLGFEENITSEVSDNFRLKNKKKNNNFICSMILATITKSKITIDKNKPKFYKIKKLF